MKVLVIYLVLIIEYFNLITAKTILENLYDSVSNENDLILKYISEMQKENNLNFAKKLLQINNSIPKINPEIFLTVPQLIKKHNYPVEIHTVQTPDGYLLETHRLPNKGGVPVLLMHGILDSSAGWIVMGPNKSLGYILHDLGYDVWLGNTRGNIYGRKHVYLDEESSNFWDFSFHELGTMDLPAIFDYILEKTERKKLHYIAHSQGSTAFFVMCHHRENYCDKTISMNALSPVAYLYYMKSPLVKGLSKILYSLNLIANIFGIKEILPNSEILKMAGQIFCKEESMIQPLCVNLMFLVCGYDSEQLNKTMLPVILGHMPAGASVKQLVHFGQLVRSGNFQMYDHGYFKNFWIYRKFSPPLYDLSKVTAAITVHYSMNDWISNQKDVFHLLDELPNVNGRYLVPLPKFNHMDFLLAINAKELIYDQVIKVMTISENNNNNNNKTVV